MVYSLEGSLDVHGVTIMGWFGRKDTVNITLEQLQNFQEKEEALALVLPRLTALEASLNTAEKASAKFAEKTDERFARVDSNIEGLAQHCETELFLREQAIPLKKNLQRKQTKSALRTKSSKCPVIEIGTRPDVG